MKSIVLSITFLLFISVSLKAQTGINPSVNYYVVEAMDYFRMEQMTKEKLTKTLTEQDIEGSPYLSDEFSNGTVYTTEKYKVVDVPIRYNIYNDDLEFKTPEDKIMAVSKPETIELADFGTFKMSYRNYITGSKERSGYFKIVEEGNATLLAKSEVFFQKAEPGDGIKPGKPARFVSKPDMFYISVDKQPALRINKKNDVYEALKSHTKGLEAYVKQNKLKLTKEDDLQQLIKYYNSL